MSLSRSALNLGRTSGGCDPTMALEKSDHAAGFTTHAASVEESRGRATVHRLASENTTILNRSCMTSSKSVGCAASWRRSPAVSLRVRCWPRTNAVQRLSMAAAALLATRSSMEFTPALRCASRLWKDSSGSWTSLSRCEWKSTARKEKASLATLGCECTEACGMDWKRRRPPSSAWSSVGSLYRSNTPMGQKVPLRARVRARMAWEVPLKRAA
mmetsp:Transcript_26007/g.97967  ORF Transcript_26007/g.97967 Transcript_26007/m.97967 type:complete len:214 (+) Transcript_26007:287-928(+)